MRICERRSRAEATSSIAFVTFRVFVIERTRRFRSSVDANYAACSSVTAKRDLTFSISAFSCSASSSGRSPLSRIVYSLVGLSALWQIVPLLQGRE